MVTLTLRASHGGPFAHQWIELDGPGEAMTIGFGPASIPFIDAGKMSMLDGEGKFEKMTGLHLFFHRFNYAKAPGSGRIIGEPIRLTPEQAEQVVEKLRHRFIAPYVPMFHDCRTFVCALRASVQGKSSLPCYLLFKGYW